MPHVLFLGNQLGDVDTLFGHRIPLGRDFFSLISIHTACSLSLQSFQPCQLHALTNPKSIRSAAVNLSLPVPPVGRFWRTPFRGFNSFKNNYLLVDSLMMGKCFYFYLVVHFCSCYLVIMMNWIWVVQDLL
ncbi:hypothetical protein Hanom_Chr09g00859831 [Helianthus anomalus]